MSVMLYPCMFCYSVNGSVCFVCFVFDSFCELFGVLVCVEVLCWIYHVWSSKECVCCACDPSERLGAPSICCVFVCRKLSPHLGV